MYISIYRKTTNSLYTEGKLLINGKLQSYTLEPTDIMLPEGEYQLLIKKQSPRKQTLSIMDTKGLPTSWKLGLAHSFLDAKKKMAIALGSPIIPGTLSNGSPVLERLTDRITKCLEREEPIVLSISNMLCIRNLPSSHWFTPVDHNCPPTTIHVEEAGEDTLHVYDGDQLIQIVDNNMNEVNSEK